MMREETEPKLEAEGSSLPPSRAALALPSFADARHNEELAAGGQPDQPKVCPALW